MIFGLDVKRYARNSVLILYVCYIRSNVSIHLPISKKANFNILKKVWRQKKPKTYKRNEITTSLYLGLTIVYNKMEQKACISYTCSCRWKYCTFKRKLFSHSTKDRRGCLWTPRILRPPADLTTIGCCCSSSEEESACRTWISPLSLSLSLSLSLDST